MRALLYDTQKGKDAVWDSTRWVGLCWSAPEGGKTVEVLVYINIHINNSYL